jgi:uncharacterized phiE125 gp8 family phage protein
MPNLQLAHTTAAATTYAIVRKISDNAVWDVANTTWATWANASLSDYDVPLADRGGDHYTATTEPSDITTGTSCRAYYYLQAGASPATTDTLLGTDDIAWNQGAASSSTVDLSAYALTTLESVKRHLRITASDDDTLLTQLINSATAEIERVIGRKIVSRTYRERINGARQRVITLANWPIQSVTKLAWGNATSFTVSYSGAAIRATAGVYDGAFRLETYNSSGVASTSNLTFATYPSASLLVAAINNVSGWTATLTTDCSSYDLNPNGGADAKSKTVLATYPDVADTIYTVDHDRGLLEMVSDYAGLIRAGAGVLPVSDVESSWPEYRRRFPSGPQWLLCQYVAGYTTVPDDISHMCNVLVQDAYYEGLTDRTMMSQTLGPFSWKANPRQAVMIHEQLGHYIDISRQIGGQR